MRNMVIHITDGDILFFNTWVNVSDISDLLSTSILRNLKTDKNVVKYLSIYFFA